MSLNSKNRKFTLEQINDKYTQKTLTRYVNNDLCLVEHRRRVGFQETLDVSLLFLVFFLAILSLLA